MNDNYDGDHPKIIMRSPLQNQKFNFIDELRQNTEFDGWPQTSKEKTTQSSVYQSVDKKKRLG